MTETLFVFFQKKVEKKGLTFTRSLSILFLTVRNGRWAALFSKRLRCEAMAAMRDRIAATPRQTFWTKEPQNSKGWETWAPTACTFVIGAQKIHTSTQKGRTKCFSCFLFCFFWRRVLVWLSCYCGQFWFFVFFGGNFVFWKIFEFLEILSFGRSVALVWPPSS